MSAVITSLVLMVTSPTLNLTALDQHETWISDEYIEYVNEICEEYCICPEMVIAIIEHESRGQADVSNGDCKGLMQVSERWHKDRMERLGVTDLYDPYGNILVGVDYLSELFAEYHDIGTVLMIYNGSSNAVSRGESGDYTDYAESIIERSCELEELHGKHDYY